MADIAIKMAAKARQMGHIEVAILSFTNFGNRITQRRSKATVEILQRRDVGFEFDGK